MDNIEVILTSLGKMFGCQIVKSQNILQHCEFDENLEIVSAHPLKIGLRVWNAIYNSSEKKLDFFDISQLCKKYLDIDISDTAGSITITWSCNQFVLTVNCSGRKYEFDTTQNEYLKTFGLDIFSIRENLEFLYNQSWFVKKFITRKTLPYGRVFTLLQHF